MTVTGKVVKGSGVTVAQVFDGGGGNTLCELQFNGKSFGLFYEESKDSGGNNTLNAPAALNTNYTSPYFKVGNHDQNTSAGPISTTAHSIVENYSVVVVHQ